MGNGQRIVRGYGLYEQLKEYKPTKLVAVDADGEQFKINVPEVRQRHARVMQALKEIAWTRVDLLDKKDGLLYRHQRNADDREQPAGDLEELQPTARVAELSGLVSIMLRSQEVVLTRHQAAIQGTLDAQNRLVESMMRRFDLQEQQYERAMELNHTLSADLVSAQLAQLQGAPIVDQEGKLRPESDRAINALLPQIMRALLDKGSLKDHPKKPSGSNGANGKHSSNGVKEPTPTS
jgi:hypothetical protein